MSEYKSRFCPSPTGFLHLGNLRTALLNVLLALQTKGTFLLRIEDTDQERSEKRYADAVCEDLEWMNFNWQEGPKVGDVETKTLDASKPITLDFLTNPDKE